MLHYTTGSPRSGLLIFLFYYTLPTKSFTTSCCFYPRQLYRYARFFVKQQLHVIDEHNPLDSVYEAPDFFISSKSRVYSFMVSELVGLLACQSVGFSKRTVVIGRTGSDTIPSKPHPTLIVIRRALPRGVQSSTSQINLSQVFVKEPFRVHFVTSYNPSTLLHATETT